MFNDKAEEKERWGVILDKWKSTYFTFKLYSLERQMFDIMNYIVQ